MTAIDIMKLGGLLNELDKTADNVLSVISVLRNIPGKNHDDDVDALYLVHDEIRAEMERLAKGIGNDTESEGAYWYIPYFDNEPADFIVCSNCLGTPPNNKIATRYCPVCGRRMSFAKLYSGGINEQKTEEKEDEETAK